MRTAIHISPFDQRQTSQGPLCFLCVGVDGDDDMSVGFLSRRSLTILLSLSLSLSLYLPSISLVRALTLPYVHTHLFSLFSLANAGRPPFTTCSLVQCFFFPATFLERSNKTNTQTEPEALSVTHLKPACLLLRPSMPMNVIFRTLF